MGRPTLGVSRVDERQHSRPWAAPAAPALGCLCLGRSVEHRIKSGRRIRRKGASWRMASWFEPAVKPCEAFCDGGEKGCITFPALGDLRPSSLSLLAAPRVLSLSRNGLLDRGKMQLATRQGWVHVPTRRLDPAVAVAVAVQQLQSTHLLSIRRACSPSNAGPKMASRRKPLDGRQALLDARRSTLDARRSSLCHPTWLGSTVTRLRMRLSLSLSLPH